MAFNNEGVVSSVEKPKTLTDLIETICHPSLICILTELVDRIEALESEVKILNRKLTDDTFEVIKNENCN
jgi:hypothetical protein